MSKREGNHGAVSQNGTGKTTEAFRKNARSSMVYSCPKISSERRTQRRLSCQDRSSWDTPHLSAKVDVDNNWHQRRESVRVWSHGVLNARDRTRVNLAEYLRDIGNSDRYQIPSEQGILREVFLTHQRQTSIPPTPPHEGQAQGVTLARRQEARQAADRGATTTTRPLKHPKQRRRESKQDKERQSTSQQLMRQQQELLERY
ncbi:hypothetical protein SARC_00275 [Sphaeroforma arctica JP610]|uniref:Uncharacterized protein n=1 Tax=Sphaeroforma arctica JP610 TaxID=667725 RepID=A0A0L0GFN3_9EUKA|nr:hypothetical protein SARC_00275 [Sphaeroforma arctica JP610]KNC87646.1 hypothetical protein SARC_00275 [Sphaeroforma arctica JP610]|eukprot:XP_014161548.1 hypothetical protein SARC_00275 [Sphaeroforma arctica JP610]